MKQPPGNLAFQSMIAIGGLLMARQTPPLPRLRRSVLSVSRRPDRPPQHVARRQLRRLQRVSRFYVSRLAHLATRLAAMPEGERTVLDHSCLMFINNMWSGSQHDSSKAPLLLVGGLNGQLETGRVLDFKE